MTTVDALDPVIHAPVRLRIVATLAQLGPRDSLTFARLQNHLDLTAGNLLTHLRKLDDAGYTATGKATGPTTVTLTDAGRAAFAAYRSTLAAVLAPQAEKAAGGTDDDVLAAGTVRTPLQE